MRDSSHVWLTRYRRHAAESAAAGADLSQFVKDKFDSLLECGILAHGLLRLRCDDCGHDKRVAFRGQRRGFCPSCGARRMARTAAHQVDHVIPHLLVRRWVLSLPIPHRLLLAGQPKPVTPVLQVVHRAIKRRLPGQTRLTVDLAHSGAVMLIQRLGSAADFNIDLHCLVLDAVYRCDTGGEAVFVPVPAVTDEARRLWWVTTPLPVRPTGFITPRQPGFLTSEACVWGSRSIISIVSERATAVFQGLAKGNGPIIFNLRDLAAACATADRRQDPLLGSSLTRPSPTLRHSTAGPPPPADRPRVRKCAMGNP